MPNYFFSYKEWQAVLGLHLVLMTLHEWLTIEQDEWISDTNSKV